MAVDPTQLSSSMSVDKSDDFRIMTCSTPKLGSKPSNNLNIGTSSNCKSTPKQQIQCKHIIEFIDSTFAQSLIPHIGLLGITNNYIQKLLPFQSLSSWINIGLNDKDIEDASYLLLDNNTKLLRSGGLLNDKYISSVSICDLTQNNNNNNNINWISLPRLSHRRHGHNTLCINLFDNKPHIIVLGGFDSKGNAIAKSEILSLNDVQSHIQSSLQQKKSNKNEILNGYNNNNNNRKRNDNQEQKRYWNTSELVELPVGIADFGECYDFISNRIYICGGLDGQFKSLSQCIMYDIQSNKWLNLPNLNYQRHCNKTQLLYSSNNPNILMTFGGWTGISRNTIEIIDLRSNANKWQIYINNKDRKKKKKGGKGGGKGGYGIFNYPHSNTASIVKTLRYNKGNNNNNNIQQKLNGLNINNKSCSSATDENVVIVCGHREGLFIETNVIEALEIRTRKWHTIATFKYAQNCNINQNLINVQQTPPTQNNNNIEITNFAKYHRHNNAFRYLTLL